MLDRNHNGIIDNGKELFGNSVRANGFLALAEFDRSVAGGNQDRIIDQRDAIFDSLRLWIDENHDGISQSAELHTLHEFGIVSMDLNYRPLMRRDEFGNLFRYKSTISCVAQEKDAETARWIYDVFLASQ